MLPNAWYSLACARDLRGLYKTERHLPRPQVLNPDNLLTRRYGGKASAKAICQRRGQGGLWKSFSGSQTSSLTTSYPSMRRDTLDGQEESPDSYCRNVRVRGFFSESESLQFDAHSYSRRSMRLCRSMRGKLLAFFPLH